MKTCRVKTSFVRPAGKCLKAAVILLIATLFALTFAPTAFSMSSTPMWVTDLFSGIPSPGIDPIGITRPLEQPSIGPALSAGEQSIGEIPFWVKVMEVQNVGRASPFYDEVMGSNSR